VLNFSFFKHFLDFQIGRLCKQLRRVSIGHALNGFFDRAIQSKIIKACVVRQMENLVSCLHHLVKEVGEVVYGKGVFIEVGDEVIPQELYLFWHFFVDKVHIEDG